MMFVMLKIKKVSSTNHLYYANDDYDPAKDKNVAEHMKK